MKIKTCEVENQEKGAEKQTLFGQTFMTCRIDLILVQKTYLKMKLKVRNFFCS